MDGFLNGLFNGLANVMIAFVSVNIYLEILKRYKPSIFEIISLYLIVFASLFRASIDFNNMMNFNHVEYTVIFALARNYATLFILLTYVNFIKRKN